jgi:hypothetical protein
MSCEADSERLSALKSDAPKIVASEADKEETACPGVCVREREREREREARNKVIQRPFGVTFRSIDLLTKCCPHKSYEPSRSRPFHQPFSRLDAVLIQR